MELQAPSKSETQQGKQYQILRLEKNIWLHVLTGHTRVDMGPPKLKAAPPQPNTAQSSALTDWSQVLVAFPAWHRTLVALLDLKHDTAPVALLSITLVETLCDSPLLVVKSLPAP